MLCLNGKYRNLFVSDLDSTLGWTAPFKQAEVKDDRATPTGMEVRLTAAKIRILNHDKKVSIDSAFSKAKSGSTFYYTCIYCIVSYRCQAPLKTWCRRC